MIMSNNGLNQIRVLVAKAGLDGHDRGAKVVARGLRDAGFEVIYTGLRQTPEMIVNTALHEDVDAIGLSFLSGVHMTLFPPIHELMQAEGMDDIRLFVGGIISKQDAEILKKEYNVGGIFGPGTSLDTIITFVKEEMIKRERLE